MPESQLTTHDLTVPIKPVSDATTGHPQATIRYLRVLLFSPSAVEDAKLAATVQRVQRFAYVTGGRDIAIIFTISVPPPATPSTTFTTAKQLALTMTPAVSTSAGAVAYYKLKLELQKYAETRSINVLPSPTPAGVPRLLHSHAASLTGGLLPQDATMPSTGFDLLQLCTTNPPMAQQTAYVLSDLFPNLRTLAEACPSASSSSPAAGLSSSQTNYHDDNRVLGMLHASARGPVPRMSFDDRTFGTQGRAAGPFSQTGNADVVLGMRDSDEDFAMQGPALVPVPV